MATSTEQKHFSGLHLFCGIFLIAVGFASIATTRLDIAIILPEVMKGIGVASISVGGLISTFTVLGTGIAEPFFGRLSDLISRRLALALGLGLFSLFSLLTAVATNLPSMLVVRILLGMAQGMFIPAYFAFIGGAFKRRGLVLGSLAGLFTVGSAINPLTTRGIFLSAGKAWQAPFIVYGIFGLVLALVVFGFGAGGLYERGRTHASAATVVSEAQAVAEGKTGIFSSSMLLLMAVMVCWGLTQYGYLGLFVTFLRTHQHFTLGDAAKVASIASWTSFVFSFFGGWLSDHIGRRTALLIFGVVGLVVSYPLFTVTTTFGTALVLAAVFQAANGTFYPLGVAYSQDMARAQHLGGHSGAVSGIGHLMAGVSGLIAGSIAAAAGFGAIGIEFVIGSAIMVICLYFTIDPVQKAKRTARELALHPQVA